MAIGIAVIIEPFQIPDAGFLILLVARELCRLSE